MSQHILQLSTSSLKRQHTKGMRNIGVSCGLKQITIKNISQLEMREDLCGNTFSNNILLFMLLLRLVKIQKLMSIRQPRYLFDSLYNINMNIDMKSTYTLNIRIHIIQVLLNEYGVGRGYKKGLDTYFTAPINHAEAIIYLILIWATNHAIPFHVFESESWQAICEHINIRWPSRRVLTSKYIPYIFEVCFCYSIHKYTI